MKLSVQIQTLILTILVAGVSALTLWCLYPNAPLWHDRAEHRLPVSAFPVWQQPAAIATLPISPEQWPIAFERIESRFAGIEVTREGELPLDATMAVALEQAFLQLPAEASEALLARVGTLFRKSFPGAKGEQLAVLFRNYWRYERAKRAMEAGNAGHSPGSEAAFDAALDLQRQYLGKQAAEQLFGKQNTVSAYLLARRQIREDDTLSDAAKQKRLALIQRAYQENNFE